MERVPFYAAQNFRLFQELITCGSSIYSWTYSPEGELLNTNCPDLVLDTVFTTTGCKEYMLHYAESETAPLVLSAPLGLMWCAAFEQNESGRRLIRLIGPVFSTEISFSGIEHAMRQYDVPLNWHSGFQKLLQDIPVVSTVLFFQYGLMLHYCVSGEKLARSDIQFQQTETTQKKSPATVQKDRHQTWMAEQSLLRNVREGDINFKGDLERAGQLSRGVQVSTNTPILQAIISEAVFTSLCTRAAIEGGLSPEVAYSLGDSYIQSAASCKSISELQIIGHTMYDDFIQRVRKCRTGPQLSQQVRACRDYIELHLEEELTLDLLARRVGYAPYYLSRKFKKEMNVSVNEYIRYVRVERARALLSYSDESIAQIAEQLCFCSSSHFSDIFKAVTGQLPQEYRRRTQEV